MKEARIPAVFRDLLGVLLLLDPFPRAVWICCFWSFGWWFLSLCHILWFLLRLGCGALDLLLFFLFSDAVARSGFAGRGVSLF